MREQKRAKERGQGGGERGWKRCREGGRGGERERGWDRDSEREREGDRDSEREREGEGERHTQETQRQREKVKTGLSIVVFLQRQIVTTAPGEYRSRQESRAVKLSNVRHLILLNNRRQGFYDRIFREIVSACRD